MRGANTIYVNTGPSSYMYGFDPGRIERLEHFRA